MAENKIGSTWSSSFREEDLCKGLMTMYDDGRLAMIKTHIGLLDQVS